MKNIMMLVHEDEGQEARLQAALDVARAVGGHLTCLDVAILPMLVHGYYNAAGAAMLISEERTREEANKAKVEEHLGHEDVPWDWVDACGELVPCVTEAASLADLIVVNRKLDSFPVPDMLDAASSLIVKSRKPILAVPESSHGIRPSGHAFVAWDGSPAATTALRSAVPLLKLAETVTLFEVDDGSVETPAEDAASYLSREDIHAIVERELLAKDSAPDRLCAESRNRNVDYIVMGGFGHSRWREAVFGGVTRRMLTESAVPLFLAH